ncbi:MAG: hypothetical protein H0V37_09215 [Chloroflexia bacterium]|nr:hypothetical protein [Chloroflexia bacterium]
MNPKRGRQSLLASARRATPPAGRISGERASGRVRNSVAANSSAARAVSSRRGGSASGSARASVPPANTMSCGSSRPRRDGNAPDRNSPRLLTRRDRTSRARNAAINNGGSPVRKNRVGETVGSPGHAGNPVTIARAAETPSLGSAVPFAGRVATTRRPGVSKRRTPAISAAVSSAGHIARRPIQPEPARPVART